MFELDLRSRKPIYEQLVENVKEMIVKEVLKTNDKLPSVRSLAQQLTINPNTIQKAYRELENQGFIYSLQGKGNFVSSPEDVVDMKKELKLKAELKKLMAEAFYLGMTADDIYRIVLEVEESIKGGSHID
jgi:GntR family transcriptional regulator